MDYKDTLNMPSTNFEMKANLNKKEPIFQKRWIDLKIEQAIYEQNADQEKFILHDGPPYANGDLHIGHALNKVLKDFIVRYKNGVGFNSVFIAGWDTHGMPIEIALQKKKKMKDLSVHEKRDLCKEFASSWIEKQKTQFTTMGLMTNFSEIYRTFDTNYEINQIKIFFHMLNNGLIYKDLKPIYWSWSSQTALAEAEVEYANVESDSIYFTFKIHESKILAVGDQLLVWTTTPWTVPSNLAVAIHPDYEYVRVETSAGNLILLEKNHEELLGKLDIEIINVLNKFKGDELEHDLYVNSLYPEKISKIILAKYVLEDGTGIVHNAPGFGNDDYLACKKYEIDVFCPIDEYGKFTSEVNDETIEGLFYLDANPIIIEKLRESGNLIQYEKITHSAAHDWRTKKPVIYRATKQWFVNLSKIKDEIISSLDDVSSKQGNSIIDKIKEMVENRQEWCISRQRYWGVPIPIIYDEDGEPIVTKKLQKRILEIFSEEGSNSWFIHDAEYFINKSDDEKTYTKETDIMDVWFDSGSSHTLMHDLKFPVDLYLEGKDQFRGWFNSSLITSAAYNGIAPYRELLSHGFVLDSQGRKMSKSLGNVVSLPDVFNKYGADIFRIWCASSDFSDDVKISNNILDQSTEIYRRIRNTIFKFILSNLSDFTEKDLNYDFSKADLYIIHKMNKFLKKIHTYYENYDFKNVIKNINKTTLELSTWYFEYIKDSLYCDEKNNLARRSIQTVLFFILKAFMTILNPIIPHTTEEVYDHLEIDNKLMSVHLERIVKEIRFGRVRLVVNEKAWNNFFEFRDLVLSRLEVVRQAKLINKNNEAKLIIQDLPSCDLTLEELTKYLNVAEIEINKKAKDVIWVQKSRKIKCERCWNYFTRYEMNNDTCNRCYALLKT
ncbi:MAG: isoleucine--tRNA ligase [Mycoplasmoidaceae bacterium]